MEQKLSPFISYGHYNDATLLIDHKNKDEFLMNGAAGELLDRIDSGSYMLTEEEKKFIRELRNLGILKTEEQPVSFGREKPTGNTEETSVVNDYYASSREHGNLIAMTLELTHKCPLNCRHCALEHKNFSHENKLSINEIKNLLSEFRNMGGMFVTFTGGEPFSRKDFADIVVTARELRLAVTILSSGYGAEPSIIREICANGLYNVQISLHGPNAAVHDEFTGIRGSFDAALLSLRAFRDHDVDCSAAITVTKYNAPYQDEITELLENENIIAGYNYIIMPSKNTSMNNENLVVSDAVLRKSLMKIPAGNPPRFACRTDNDPVCDAGRTIISVSPEGFVSPCIGIRDTDYSIRNYSLSDIMKKSESMKRIRSLKVKDLEDCLHCPWKTRCNRCSALALAENHTITEHSWQDCRMARIISEISLSCKNNKTI
ncbi:MAG: radical SAM protein [bacterium]